MEKIAAVVGRPPGGDDRRDAEGILWAAEAAVAVKDFWTDSEERKGGSDGHGGWWVDAIVMRLCRPASLGNGRTGRRSEKCSLKMLIARVAFLEAAVVSLFARPVVHFCRRTLEWTGRSKRKEKWENDRRTRWMVVDRWPQRMRRDEAV